MKCQQCHVEMRAGVWIVEHHAYGRAPLIFNCCSSCMDTILGRAPLNKLKNAVVAAGYVGVLLPGFNKFW